MRSPRAAVAVLILLAAAQTGCNKIKSRQEIKKGNEYFKATQYQAALASYQEAQRLDPGEKKLDKFIGEAYIALYQPGSKHQKDIEFANNAIKHLQTYLQTYPNDRKVREYLVSMYLSQDRYDDAIGFYQDLLKTDPKDSKAMSSLAAMYFKKGDFQNGLEWEKKRAALDPRNPEPYVMIGVQAWDRSYHYPDVPAEIRGKIVADGMEALQTALKLKPDNFDALTYMNLLYREKAKIETDEAKKLEDVAAADKYREQALELRKKSLATTPTTATPEPGK
jgi:cytochrome c-type biogenesis protein CcmH/NrfG